MIRTVLIVDDDEQIALALAAALDNIGGWRAIPVRDAHAALRIITDETCAVGALVTDLDLPMVDGCSLIRQIRATPGYRRIPVLMITANERASFGTDAEESPNVIMKKPFSYREVRRVVEQMLEESSAADSVAGDDLPSADVPRKHAEDTGPAGCD